MFGVPGGTSRAQKVSPMCTDGLFHIQGDYPTHKGSTTPIIPWHNPTEVLQTPSHRESQPSSMAKRASTCRKASSMTLRWPSTLRLHHPRTEGFRPHRGHPTCIVASSSNITPPPRITYNTRQKHSAPSPQRRMRARVKIST